MTKKKFGFVQVNFQQGPKEFNSYHLPYSAGLLISYALSKEHICEEWEMGELIWRRDPIESTAQKFKDHSVVGFSTYVWNREYHYALAKRIKELNPDCWIVMGGPEPPVADWKIYTRYPWMDIAVKVEGELLFNAVLERYTQGIESLKDLTGMVINVRGQAVDTGEAERIQDIDQIPSPYLTGVFDKLMADNPEVEWSATIETNRGCPYACTFCDYGADIYNKVKVFANERVEEELEWIGKNCGYITIADANFGIFVERDAAFMDKIVETQRKYKKLTNMSITWAKNKKPELLNVVKKFIENSPTSGQGLTLSVQTMDEDVLDIIKRRNLEQHKFKSMFEWCEKNGVPAYSEIILGLPGQSAKSWKENFWKMLDAGNHTGINILQCQLLENAEMNLLQRKLYKMESRPIYDYISGTYEVSEIDEFVEVVVGTKDLPPNEMMEIWIWDALMQTFHINGITVYISRYLNKVKGVSYQEFYDRLFEFLPRDAWWKDEIQTTRDCYQEWIDKGRVRTHLIGGIQIPGWNLHNRTTLNLHATNKFDDLYRLIGEFLKVHYPMDHIEELIEFQKNTLTHFKEMTHYPKVVEFEQDFFGFVNDDTPLDQPVTYEFSTLENPNMSLQVFLENFYFGRKRNFGKTRIKRLS
jgi:putative methyltransferase